LAVVRASYRFLLIIFTLSVFGLGAQSLLCTYDGGVSKHASFNREVFDASVDQIARRTFRMIVHVLIESDERAIAPLFPEAAILQEIPGHESYRYAVIGDQRFIIDSASHSVIYRLN
jgi:hypothetical protein